jgi:hypothetical protein
LHLGALLHLRGLPLLNLCLHLGALLGLGSLSLLCLGYLLLRLPLSAPLGLGLQLLSLSGLSLLRPDSLLLCPRLSRRLPLLRLLPALPCLLLTPLLHVSLSTLGLYTLGLRAFTGLALPRLFTGSAISL